MTYREKYLSLTTWQDKVLIMNLYHCLKELEETSWTLRKTAKYFSKSTGYVSESLKLANHMELIKHCELRKDALLIVRDIK